MRFGFRRDPVPGLTDRVVQGRHRIMEPHPHDEAADLTFREWLEGNLPEAVPRNRNFCSPSFSLPESLQVSDKAVLPHGGKVHQVAGTSDPCYYTEKGGRPSSLDESLSPVAAKETMEMLRSPEMEYFSTQYSLKPGIDEVIGLVTLDQLSFTRCMRGSFPRLPDWSSAMAEPLRPPVIFSRMCDGDPSGEDRARKAHSFSSSIGTYLYSVCRHILGDQFRRNKRDQKMESLVHRKVP